MIDQLIMIRYSGSSTRDSALSMLWLSLMSISIVSLQVRSTCMHTQTDFSNTLVSKWWFWGYSLAFSHTSKSQMIGNLDNFVFRNLLNSTSASTIKAPELAFAVYQGMFAAFT